MTDNTRKAGADRTPLDTGSGIEPVAAGVCCCAARDRAVAEIDEGLVVVDAGPGGRVTAGMIASLREVSTRPVVALCYSHGHVGYNAGVPLWLEDAVARARAPAPYRPCQRAGPLCALPPHRRPAEPHQCAAVPPPAGPYCRPAAPARSGPDLCRAVGAGQRRRVHLLWAPSETDDVSAVWVPGARVLYGSAAVIDSIPNIGTPFRTLRDTLRWAGTLERLADLRPLAARERARARRPCSACWAILPARCAGCTPRWCG